MTIFGMLRIKDEAKWIGEVLASILPLCERVFVLDDHSDDATPNICERFDDRVTLIRSPFEGLDESRDKQFLLERIMGCVSDIHDEVLTPGVEGIIMGTLNCTGGHAFKLPIRYLWNDRQHVRVDGVYRHFARPSIFRLMNRAFQFQKTPWGNGANFHCSSIPQELLHHAHALCPAPLLHLGYMEAALRARKFAWYTKIDPENRAEGFYLHCIQGDTGGPPAHVKLLHAGPLEIIPIETGLGFHSPV